MKKQIHWLGLSWLCILLFAACGNGTSDLGAQANANNAPVHVTDCGERPTVYTKVPQRVVAMDGSAAEILLALGLKDHLIAVGYPNPLEQIPPPIVQDFKQVKTTFKEYPGKEALLAQRPDFVVSILPSAFSEASHNYTQEGLTKLGISSYLGRGNCAAVPNTDTLEPTYTDILNLGQIFHVDSRAQALVAKMKAQIAHVQQQVKGAIPLRVMSFEGGDTPFVVGGRGTANTILQLAGAKNIFADIPKNFAKTTWEEVVARDPQAIWIVPNSGGAGSCCTARDIEQFLLTYPPLAKVTAIKEHRFVVVYQNEGEFENVSNADAVVKMAHGFYPEKVK